MDCGADLYVLDPIGGKVPVCWLNPTEDVIDRFLSGRSPPSGPDSPFAFLIGVICEKHPINFTQFTKAINRGWIPTYESLKSLKLSDARLVIKILTERGLYNPYELISQCNDFTVACLIESPKMIQEVDLSRSDKEIIVWMKKLLEILNEPHNSDNKIDIVKVVFELFLTPCGRQFIDDNHRFRGVILSKIEELSTKSDELLKYRSSYYKYWGRPI